MKLDQHSIVLRPLTTPNTLDLALLFLSQRLRLAGSWTLCALCGCAANYLLVDRGGGDLGTACVLFFFWSGVLGTLIGLDTAETAFGGPREDRAPRSRRKRVATALLIFRCLCLRLAIATGLIFFILPGCWLAVRYGFVVEQAALTRLDRRLFDRSTSDLIRGEVSDLFFRGASIAFFCGLLWIVVVSTADMASWLLFGSSLLMGPLFETIVNFAYLSEMEGAVSYFLSFLWNDPALVTGLLAAAFLVYTLGRVAWFLCYVDLRVRRDCWDVELEIVREAELLRGGPEGKRGLG